jgi:hypothetical protein
MVTTFLKEINLRAPLLMIAISKESSFDHQQKIEKIGS